MAENPSDALVPQNVTEEQTRAGQQWFNDYDQKTVNGFWDQPRQDDPDDFMRKYDESFGDNPRPGQQLTPDDQWDYKTAQLDKQGKPLPAGALGFDPLGRAYYGDGIAGWLKGAYSRITNPEGEAAKFDFTKVTDEKTDLATKGMAVLQNISEVPKLSDSFGINSPLTVPARILKEGLGGLMTGMQVPAQFFERVIGVGSSALQDTLGLYGDSATAAQSLEERWQASSITYSSFLDVEKRNQFYKGLREGQNPEFLAMQLENPMAELIGQMVLDPLVLVGMATKGAKVANTLAIETQKIAMSGAMRSEQVATLVKNLMSVGGDLEKLDDLKAVGKIESIFADIDAAVDATKTGMASYKPGVFSRLTASQQAVTNLEAGKHFQWSVEMMKNMGANADEIGDLVHHTAMLASDVEGERNIAKAFILRHHPMPNIALSDEGLKSSNVLYQMAGKDPDAFLKGLKTASELDGKAGIIKFVQDNIGKASKEMYPSVTDMREAAEISAKATPGAELTARQVFLAKQYDNMSMGTKSAEKLATTLLAEKYRQVQGTMNSIYLSSPGYVMRNIFNNAFTGFVDMGAGLFFSKKGSAFGAGEELSEGAYKFFGKSAEQLNDMAGSNYADRIMDTMGQAGDAVQDITKGSDKVLRGAVENVLTAVPKMADSSERGFRLLIHRKSMQDTFEKLLQPGKFLPNTDRMAQAGMSPEAIKMFTRAILDENGNLDRAYAKISGAATKTGLVDKWRDTNNLISLEMRRFLGGRGMLDDVHKLIKDGDFASAEEAKAALTKLIKDDLMKDAAKLPDDLITTAQKGIAAPLSNDMSAAADLGLLPDGQSELFTAMVQAGHKLQNEIDGGGQLLNLLTPNNPQSFEFMQNLLKEKKLIGDQVSSATQAITKDAWRLTDLKKAGKITNVDKMYLDKLGIPAPAGATADTFINDLWAKTHADVRGKWEDYFIGLKERLDETYKGLRPSIVDQKAGAQADALYKKVQDTFSEYQDLRSATFDGKNLIKTPAPIDPLQGLTGKDAVTKLGSLYGIPTQADNGRKLDNVLLNTINKYKDTAPVGTMPPASLIDTGKAIADTPGEALQKVMSLPRSQVPAPVSDSLLHEARKMLDEVLSGQAGKRTAESVTHSTYPEWYGELVKKAGGKSSVITALEKIIKDKGSDVGKTVERLKEVGLNGIWDGDKTMGIPPNLHVMQLMGANESDIAKSLDTYNDIAFNTYGRDLTLTEALANDELAAIASQARNIDAPGAGALQTRLDEIAGQFTADLPDDIMQRYLDAMNAVTDAGANNSAANMAYKTLDEIPADIAKAALERRRIEQGLPDVAEFSPPPPQKLAPVYGGNEPTTARVASENLRGIEPELKRMGKYIDDSWGQDYGTIDPAHNEAMLKYIEEARPQIELARKVGLNVAEKAGNFALLDYAGGKRGFDAALAYIMPFEFWPSRSYTSWLTQRVVTDPKVFSAYAQMKTAMEKIHADLPEFYKYNINSNELLGLHSENPLFFDLEKALWPLNGLTGVDFEDSNKRVDWWTATLEDMGKIGAGPSTIITQATALALYARGEKEAASRWAGRLFPATAQVKSALALGNIRLPDTPFTIGNEIDPNVNFFSGGYDPYEARRIAGGGLQKLVDNGTITAEQALDASKKRSGQIWEQAETLTSKERGAANLASWGLGVGWKGRTPTDVRLDKFSQEYQLLNAKIKGGVLSPDATRQAFADLRQKYDFMDLVILARKDDKDRDRAYAYNILSRIPPGQSSQILEASGISDALVQKFYDEKGNVSAWPEADHAKFMAAVADLSAVLAIPDNATTQDWDQARAEQDAIKAQVKTKFGADIYEKINAFYAIGSADKNQQDAQDDYMKAHPEIKAAMELRTQMIGTNPHLAAYNGGLNAVEKYYSGQMYADIKKKLGEDIYKKFEEYGQLQLYDPAQAKIYYAQNPQIKEYGKMRDAWQEYINRRVAATGSLLKPGMPAQTRTDYNPLTASTGEQGITTAIQPVQQKTWQEFSSAMPENLRNVVLDYFQQDKTLPSVANKQLERLAENMGYQSVDDLLQEMGASFYQGQP